MILRVKARRRSADLQDLPETFEFDIPFAGPAPTEIVDCENRYAFGMFQIRGQQLPRRACPLRPRGFSATEDGPPAEWIDEETKALKLDVWKDDDKNRNVKPTDRFVDVSIDTCNACKFASAATVGLKDERTVIEQAFARQLLVEDFSEVDLDADDRDIRRWIIHWDDITVV